MITNLHHVAILTYDMEEAIKYYVELFDCQQTPKIAHVANTHMKLKSAMIPIGPTGTTFLQIIEPEVGPGVSELARGGEGTLFEMGFQVDDAEEFSDRMTNRNISPSDLAEQPINEKYIQSKFGNRYFILPGNRLRGTRIEIVQIMQPPDS